VIKATSRSDHRAIRIKNRANEELRGLTLFGYKKKKEKKRKEKKKRKTPQEASAGS